LIVNEFTAVFALGHTWGPSQKLISIVNRSQMCFKGRRPSLSGSPTRRTRMALVQVAFELTNQATMLS